MAATPNIFSNGYNESRNQGGLVISIPSIPLKYRGADHSSEIIIAKTVTADPYTNILMMCVENGTFSCTAGIRCLYLSTTFGTDMPLSLTNIKCNPSIGMANAGISVTCNAYNRASK